MNEILITDDVLSEAYCDQVIKQADAVRRDSDAVQRVRSLDRTEDCIHLQDIPAFEGLCTSLKEILEPHLEAYKSTFPVLARCEFEHSLLKYNHAPRFGGIQFWHCEQRDGSVDAASRALVWMIYLNDQPIGGETEFLYQHLRIPAKLGRLVLFPASYTHTHRSAPVWTERKDVLTGVLKFKC